MNLVEAGDLPLRSCETGTRRGARRRSAQVFVDDLNSLRIDKCYRGWKSDLETGYSPFESSLDRFVDFTKPDFVGKAALQAERARGVSRRLVPLTLDHPGEADPPYCSSVFAGEERVGLATSGVWSHTLERSVSRVWSSDASFACSAASSLRMASFVRIADASYLGTVNSRTR